MAFPAILGSLATPILNIIDKIIPDPKAAALAKENLLRLEQEGGLKETEMQLSAIIAEAKSEDKWTSRARPSFLYVVYVFILAALPMGGLSYFNPEAATAVATGVQLWLQALPEGIYWLFATGYLGYTGARSIEKTKLVNMLKGNK